MVLGMIKYIVMVFISCNLYALEISRKVKCELIEMNKFNLSSGFSNKEEFKKKLSLYGIEKINICKIENAYRYFALSKILVNKSGLCSFTQYNIEMLSEHNNEQKAILKADSFVKYVSICKNGKCPKQDSNRFFPIDDRVQVFLGTESDAFYIKLSKLMQNIAENKNRLLSELFIDSDCKYYKTIGCLQLEKSLEHNGVEVEDIKMDMMSLDPYKKSIIIFFEIFHEIYSISVKFVNGEVVLLHNNQV